MLFDAPRREQNSHVRAMPRDETPVPGKASRPLGVDVLKKTRRPGSELIDLDSAIHRRQIGDGPPIATPHAPGWGAGPSNPDR
eukprot:2922010-Pyramimonas_sp.AAC.1